MSTYPTRRETLTLAINMRQKHEDIAKEPYPQGAYMDVYTPGMVRLAKMGLSSGIIGIKTYFRPDQNVSRVEAYTMVMRSVCMQIPE